jgi:type II secretory pathway component PulJ
MKLTLKKHSGYTLVELMISASIGGFILASIVIGGAAFQKIFAASNEYYRATSDQSRVLDYIARDVRRAVMVQVINGGQELVLTLPNYLSSGSPQTPTIAYGRSAYGKPNGIVDYGTAANPVAVSYSMSGQSIIRKQGTATVTNPAKANDWLVTSTNFDTTQITWNSNLQATICNDVENFQLTDLDATGSVKVTLSFMPRFHFASTADLTDANNSARKGTSVYTGIALRNPRRN